MERKGGYFACVLYSVGFGQSTHHHVGIADRLNFVDVVVFDCRVKQRVQVIQKVNNLKQDSDYWELWLIRKINQGNVNNWTIFLIITNRQN